MTHSPSRPAIRTRLTSGLILAGMLLATAVLAGAAIARKRHPHARFLRGVKWIKYGLQIRQPDAFTVTRDLFENRKGAAKRLDADPLAVVGVVVDIARRRLHQLGNRCLARTGRLLGRPLFGTRSQGI